MTTIYTDGACAKNPGGRGGWAAILLHNGFPPVVLSGTDASTTNNRMELMAAIRGLQAVTGPAVVKSDSQYLVKGASQWVTGWKKKGWVKVKNDDLWRLIDGLQANRVVEWQWVRGHNGDHYNEVCDRLANAEAGIA